MALFRAAKSCWGSVPGPGLEDSGSVLPRAWQEFAGALEDQAALALQKQKTDCQKSAEPKELWAAPSKPEGRKPQGLQVDTLPKQLLAGTSQLG